MRTIFICMCGIFYSVNVFAEDNCVKNDPTKLSIYSKNDYTFSNYTCSSEKGDYLKNYISNSKNNILVNEYSDFYGKEEPKLLAVSIYRNSLNKKKLLITIQSSYYCCSPQIEGNAYQINLYEVMQKNDVLSLKDVTPILGDKFEGFDGQSEGRVFYEFKDINSIKKWLDTNYK